ncbi:flavin reductase family protein [Streptomyces avicenniae]|uniref:flavin reductase family protein n=1 Tax=Streptomyces avicenniae TaxID=500153 RepID=UPI00069ABDCA|nr:flavin reductase family protein [Streptomyces avicenniae]
MTIGARTGGATVSAEEYKAVFRQHPAGVAVVALHHGGRPVGFTATSVISVSAAPPLLAFSLAATSSSWPAIAATDTLALSFLADHQDDVSARFATSGIDRFAAGGWSTLPTGEPVIDGAHAWIRARVLERTAVGGSFLISLLAQRAEVRAGVSPLVFHDRAYHRIGPHSMI